MKIGMLVGACGLALAGTAFGGVKGVSGSAHPRHIERFEDTSLRISPEQMAEYRASRSEAANHAGAGRSLVSNGARGVFVFQDTFDGLDGDQMPPNDPGLYIRQTDLKDPAFFEGDFSIAGQINSDLGTWAAGTTWAGIHDNAVALSNMDGDPMNGEYNGPAGGPDPLLTRGGLLSMARASVNDAPVDLGFGVRAYSMNHDLYTGTSVDPLFVRVDMYKPTHEEFMWWDPISFAEGLITSRILPGGYNDSGTFLTLSQDHGDPNLIEGAVILANQAGNIEAGEFVVTKKDMPEGGWFTLGLFVDPVNFMCVFVQDDETLADANMDMEPDWQMPDNPVTGMKMFEEYGLGLEKGWASLLPGTIDDPMTTDVIEGAGYAVNENNEVTSRFFFNGNDVATTIAAISINHSRFYEGSDPTVAELPGYEIRDWWIDDYRINGVEFPTPDPIPTYRIPYVDDMERWSVGRLSLQGGRWNETIAARSTIVANQNDTPAPGSGANGMPTQALNLQNRTQDDLYRAEVSSNIPTNPRVRGEVGDPAVVSIKYRFESVDLTYGFQASDVTQTQSDTIEYMGRLFTSATDVNGIGDDQVYVRQRKPLGTDPSMGEFDDTKPIEPLPGTHLTPDQENTVNTEFVNVLAAPMGMGSFSMSTNAWHSIRFEAEPRVDVPRGIAANGEEHIVRVFVDGTELFPGGDDTKDFTTRALGIDNIDIGSGNNFFAGFVNLWVDDLNYNGPTQSDTLVPLASEFADDVAWELPFCDTLDTYETGRPATPQGFANYRVGFMPIGDPDIDGLQDFSEIEFIDLGAPSLMDGDDVVVYTVETIDQGTPGFMVGDTVAVPLAGVFSEYDPADNVYGTNDPMQDPTKWYILDTVNGSEIARGTWRLATATGETTFDSMTMTDMQARFSYRLNFRYTGNDDENSFVDADAEGLGMGRGLVAKLTTKGNSNDNSDPNGGLRSNTLNLFTSLLPLAQTQASSDVATMSWDVYIGQADFQTGFFTTIPGGTTDGGVISAVSYGGLGLQSGNIGEVTPGVVPFLAQGNFGYQIANPLPGVGNPDEIWVDSGVAVMPNTWYTMTATVDGDANFTITADDGGGPVMVGSGVASDAGNVQFNTTSFDSMSFIRNQFGDNDGAPTLGTVTWTAQAFDAMAPASGGTSAYHFFELDEILSMADLPEIWPVDPVTGAPDMDAMMMPMTRPMASNDIVAIENVDPSTMMPFSGQVLNTKWELVTDDMAMTLRANGNWTPIGLPGQPGVTNPAPMGGISAGNTPPYNNSAPFETILLGDYKIVETSVTNPSDVWYVDNIKLDVSLVPPCPTDLNNDGQTNGGDLAILLAAWNSPGADLNGDNNTNGGDLAILLAAWGPCPM